jgi:hypothetical protein
MIIYATKGKPDIFQNEPNQFSSGLLVSHPILFYQSMQKKSTRSNVLDNFQRRLEIENSKQGCQIFLGTKYQNGKNITNCHELHQMSIKYNKRPQNGPSVHKIP